MSEVLSGMSTLEAKLSTILPNAEFYLHAAPVFALMLGAMVALLVGVFRCDPDKPHFPALGIAIVSCSVSVLLPWLHPVAAPQAFLGSGFLGDQLAQYGFVVIGLGTMATLFLSTCTDVGRNLARPELIALLLFSSSGMMILTSAGDLLTFLVGLELASIPLYALVGFQRESREGLEAAVKYFLLGSAATGVLLFGAALIYLHAGSLAWYKWGTLAPSTGQPLLLIGFLLFLCGCAFKLALAPFHAWAPDVYEGSHSQLSGYMASLVKLAIVIPLIRIATSGLQDVSGFLSFVFWILGTLSIVWGSLFGLVQPSVKRILAYSSVANAGFFAIGLASLFADPQSPQSRQALIAYSGIYPLLTLGSFAVLSWLEENSAENLTRDNLRGLGRKSPLPAVLLTMFLFGLAGMPPMAGFFGKLWILQSAVSTGYLGASVLIALASAVSLFFYLRLITLMWLHEPTPATPVSRLESQVSPTMSLTVGFLAAASLLVGIIGPRWAFSLDTHDARPEQRRSANLHPQVPDQADATHSF